MTQTAPGRRAPDEPDDSREGRRALAAPGDQHFRRIDRRHPHRAGIGHHGGSGDAQHAAGRRGAGAGSDPDRRRGSGCAGGPAQHLSRRRGAGAGRAGGDDRRDGDRPCRAHERQPAAGPDRAGGAGLHQCGRLRRGCGVLWPGQVQAGGLDALHPLSCHRRLSCGFRTADPDEHGAGADRPLVFRA